MNAARGLCLHVLRQLGTHYYRVRSSQAKLYSSQMVVNVSARAQVLMGVSESVIYGGFLAYEKQKA
ncbi:hypothetical protein ACFL2O_03295 [Thermodesulfobacteriota bacterium]